MLELEKSEQDEKLTKYSIAGNGLPLHNHRGIMKFYASLNQKYETNLIHKVNETEIYNVKGHTLIVITNREEIKPVSFLTPKEMLVRIDMIVSPPDKSLEDKIERIFEKVKNSEDTIDERRRLSCPS